MPCLYTLVIMFIITVNTFSLYVKDKKGGTLEARTALVCDLLVVPGNRVVASRSGA